MTQTTPERKPCSVCGGEFTVTASGGIRSHFTENPDFQAGPDSRKCRGAGQPPAGAAPADGEESQSQCRLCKHPVQLTGNGRARSHLTPEATPRPCPGGSDFPLGWYQDIAGTTDGLVATLARDCEHREIGECYPCAGLPVPGEQAVAPWGVNPEAVDQPTMADQLKATDGKMPCPHPEYGEDQYGDQACIVCGTVKRDDAPPAPAEDGRPEAARFEELLAKETQGVGTVLDRLPAAVVVDYRTDEQKARDARTSELTRKAIKVLEQRTPEQKAETAARMDRTASAALGFPPDPSLNHEYTDASGIKWVHGGPAEACGLCGLVDPGNAEPADSEQDARNRWNALNEEWTRQRDDGWRTPDDMIRELMPEDVQGLDALRLNCAGCGHPVTPLVAAFDLYGKAKAVEWHCENRVHRIAECLDHECRPDTRALIDDLGTGDHFIRRGVVMRVLDKDDEGRAEAVIVEGPMKGRTGKLNNPGETVERTYCRHEYGPDGDGGECCSHCGDLKTTKEQETSTCPDDTTRTTSLTSSTTSTTTTTAPAPAPGSTRPTTASVPPAAPPSSRATASAPTATAAGKDRSAAVTTDQGDAAAAFLGLDRPAATQVTDAGSQADAAMQFLAGSGTHGEKETKRDRYGRYLIPHPDTGKEQAWTRATTFAKSISDTFTLSQWQGRMTLLGATLRPDIVRRAHGKHVKQDKNLLNELVEDLKNAAGAKVAANDGTAMHSFTELADRAWHTPEGPRSVMEQIPPDSRPMVETYISLLEQQGLEPVPDLIEFTTVVKQYGVAGTSDNCYRVTRPLKLKIGRTEVMLNPGEYVIGDKKTGKDLDYGWQEIAIQLAVYAQGLNTCGKWDRHEEKWHPKPLGDAAVRLDVGVVIHLPVDPTSEKTPTVYGLDLESGWNAAVLCDRVRLWRKARNLAAPVLVSEFDPVRPVRVDPQVVTRTTVRPPTLLEKAQAVTSNTEASAVWQEARNAGLPQDEVDKLVDVMQARLRSLVESGG